jgi:hypothetical protein
MMSKKTEALVLLCARLMIIGLIGGILWWFIRGFSLNLSKFGISTPIPSNFHQQSDPKTQKTFAANTNNDLSSVPLNSIKGVDYTSLRNSLQTHNWQRANEDTTETLLKAFGSKSNQTGHVDIQEAANPPCTDLKTVDQLWSKASNGNLSFTAQRQVLRENGNDYRQAYNKMQWQRPGGEWLIQYIYNGNREKFKPGYEPNYGNPDKGHLPTFERGYNFQYSFDGTLAKCGL